MRAMGWPKKNYIGSRNGRLTIIGDLGTRIVGKKLKYTTRFLLCRCECGQNKIVRVCNLRATQSCGCLLEECRADNATAMHETRSTDPCPSCGGPRGKKILACAACDRAKLRNGSHECGWAIRQGRIGEACPKCGMIISMFSPNQTQHTKGGHST